MRSGPLAAVAVACALLGGLAALALGKATGWVGGKDTVTVFRSSPVLPEAQPAAVGPAAKPLAGNGFDPRRIYASRSAGVVTIFAQYGTDAASAQIAQGSGFVVSRNGYILTNSHVITNAGESASVHGADRVYIEFQDRDRAPAKIVGWDVFDDVGVLKVDSSAHALRPVPLGDSAAASVGEPVAAIGSPFGNEDSLGVGVVAATHRSIDSLTSTYALVDAIQTDAPINHGNSGGPLIDAAGRVIGVNAQIQSDSGGSDGVGFAIPSDTLRSVVQQLTSNGKAVHAYLGVAVESAANGARIAQVRSGGPAKSAGLRVGDVVTAIDGHKISSAGELQSSIDAKKPGDKVTLTVKRNGTSHTVRVKLGARPT